MEREIYAANEGYVLCPMTDAGRADYVELQRQIDKGGSLPSDKMWDKALKIDVDHYFSILDEHGEYCGCIDQSRSISTK